MSLTWKAAVEQTEPDEYITHQQLAQMYSGDFDEPMHRTMHNLRQDYRQAKEQAREEGDPLEEYAHPRDVAHGGPDNYIAHLKRDIAANGIQQPLTVRGGNVVVEGHHRAAAAMQLRLNRIPIRHVS